MKVMGDIGGGDSNDGLDGSGVIAMAVVMVA